MKDFFSAAERLRPTVELSVILPMFNEQEIALKTIHIVSKQLNQLGAPYEIICINDGSSDGTASIINAESKNDERIIPVHFSRNFGKESALFAGLDISRGKAVILLDADLQHPPTLIPQMVSLWKEGYDIIEGRKAKRGHESFVYLLFTKIFYNLIGNSMYTDMRGSSDFKLLDRQVVEALRGLHEKSIFFRGLVNWVGFRKKVIDFEVAERALGNTSWSLRGLIRYAFNNILAFSTIPLYLTAWLGMLTTLVGIILSVQTLYNYIAGYAVSGFTTVILLVIFFSGIILSSIGVVAIYLAKTLDEIKGRPIYIIRHTSQRDRPPNRQ